MTVHISCIYNSLNIIYDAERLQSFSILIAKSNKVLIYDFINDAYQS